MRQSIALGLSVLLGGAGMAAAQDQPAAEFLQVTTVTVKPSGVADFEDYIKKVTGAATKVGAPQQILAYQPGPGAAGYTYEFVSPFNKWSELDGFLSVPQLINKAYGDVQGAATLKAGRANIERVEVVTHRLLRSLSAPRVPPAALVQVIVTEVDPSMTSVYEMYLTKLKAAQDQMPGTPATLRWVSVLGPGSVYVSVQFFNKFAERDGAPAAGEALRKAYGEAEARYLTEASQRTVRNRRYYVSAFRPDLSRTAATTAAK